VSAVLASSTNRTEPPIASCIGCGCTDSHACLGGCHWLVVNRNQGVGVCSRCPSWKSRWDAGVRTPAIRSSLQPVPAALAGGAQRLGNSPCTPHQRLYIRTLMDRAEPDSYHACLMHRRFFEAANLPAPTPGAKLDPTLEALTRAQASALIGVLRKEVGDDD
jgi:hypothetical protein